MSSSKSLRGVCSVCPFPFPAEPWPILKKRRFPESLGPRGFTIIIIIIIIITIITIFITGIIIIIITITITITITIIIIIILILILTLVFILMLVPVLIIPSPPPHPHRPAAVDQWRTLIVFLVGGWAGTRRKLSRCEPLKGSCKPL